MKDHQILAYAKSEALRQKRELSLIASENSIYPEALSIALYPLSNKYSEGYPNKRFYRGCAYIDLIETHAIEITQKLFGCKFANVQCFSGSIANLAIYKALLKPGDAILGLDMSCGGHLSHTSPYSFVSHFYKTHSFTLDTKTLKLDYDLIQKLALEHKPKLIVAGFSSYPFSVDFQRFRQIADSVGAYLLADICHLSGLIATGLHQHCFPHAHIAMCTTHKQLRGYRGAIIMWNDSSFTIPINKSVFPGLQGGMNPSAVAINAYCLERDLEPQYKSYMVQVVENAKIMVSYLRNQGVSIIGTDTHLFLIDTKSTYGLTGQEASGILESAGYITNPNLIPFDEETPLVASGIRIGTLSLTILQPTPLEVQWISEQIHNLLSDPTELNIKLSRESLEKWLDTKYR